MGSSSGCLDRDCVWRGAGVCGGLVTQTSGHAWLCQASVEATLVTSCFHTMCVWAMRAWHMSSVGWVGGWADVSSSQWFLLWSIVLEKASPAGCVKCHLSSCMRGICVIAHRHAPQNVSQQQLSALLVVHRSKRVRLGEVCLSVSCAACRWSQRGRLSCGVAAQAISPSAMLAALRLL